MEDEQLTRIAKALSDPRRFEILQRIACECEIGCADILGGLPLTAPTVSHHMKELVNAGLVEARKEHKFGFYRLRRDVWREYLAELARRIPARPLQKS